MAKKSSSSSISRKLSAMRAEIAKHGKAILKLDRQVKHLEKYAHKHSKMKYVIPIKPLRRRSTSHRKTK